MPRRTRDRVWTVGLPARLEGDFLRAARTGWLVLVGGSLAMAVAGAIRASARPELTAPRAAVALADTIGLDLRLIFAAALLPVVGVAAVSVIVFWRRSRDPMALLFTAALVVSFVVSSRSLLAFEAHPLLRHLIPVTAAIAVVLLALVLSLFPNGRFVPRGSVWIAPAMAVLVVSSPAAGEILMRMPDVPTSMRVWPTGIVIAGWGGLTLLGVAAQAYRYRRVSDATERLQTKWVMAPLGLLFTYLVVLVILPSVFLGASERWVGWGIVCAVCIVPVIPPMLANAVLRYRLYAIDQIIGRTVSYGLLVTVLAGVYGITVVGLSWVVSSFAPGKGNSLAVAASTLAVAALFRPLRRLVQNVVDRRFNRTAYDARMAVHSFSHGLRDEVDLAEISRALVTVARDALEPAQAAVWLAGRDAAPARPSVAQHPLTR